MPFVHVSLRNNPNFIVEGNPDFLPSIYRKFKGVICYHLNTLLGNHRFVSLFQLLLSDGSEDDQILQPNGQMRNEFFIVERLENFIRLLEHDILCLNCQIGFADQHRALMHMKKSHDTFTDVEMIEQIRENEKNRKMAEASQAEKLNCQQIHNNEHRECQECEF